MSRAGRVAFLLIFAWLLGSVCYEAELVTHGDHYFKFAQQDYNILIGKADIDGFQQRLLPSFAIDLISKILGQSYEYATFITHRVLYLAISISMVTMLYFILGLSVEISAGLLFAFSVANIFTLDAGYWVMTFDLVTELFTIIMFMIFLSSQSLLAKFTQYLILFVLWQFSFEEVIYIPMLIAFALNADDIRSFNAVNMLKRPINYVLVALVGISMLITTYTRHSYAVAPLHGGSTEFLGQWIVVKENIGLIGRQLMILPMTFGTLKDGFWWTQGAGLFLIIAFLGGLVMLRGGTRDGRHFAVKLMFITMAIITFIFARLEEVNTFLPLVVALFLLTAFRFRAPTTE
ncbi:MAG: hypothetical protein P4L98_09060 [Ancalomicrobiaceae bacterium]|nr:hypothetical protein [Ancalomicrobiaceae bacterium]